MDTPQLVGANAYVHRAEPNTFLPDRLWQVKLKNSDVDLKWLAYWFASPETRNALYDLATGTSGSMKNIPKQDVLKLGIQLPSYEEQRAISSVLSAADQEIQTLQKQEKNP